MIRADKKPGYHEKFKFSEKKKKKIGEKMSKNQHQHELPNLFALTSLQNFPRYVYFSGAFFPHIFILETPFFEEGDNSNGELY